MAFKKTIKNYIEGFLPLRYYQYRRKQANFAKRFDETGYSNNCVIEHQNSKFKNVVSVQGFNYSGSGAVIDMLREYPKFTVLGYVDDPEDSGGFTPKSMHMQEIDFIRLAGGIFEVEKFLDSNNYFLNDALLNRMARCFESSSLYRYSPEIQDLMYRFFAKLVGLKSTNLPFCYYNPYLVGLNESNDIYYLKKMKKEEYHEMASDFLCSVFNVFYQEGKEYLAADQLLADGDYNYTRYLQYIPNAKIIFVARDPRDTYAWAIMRDQPQMEHSTVESFIQWYKYMYGNVNPSLEIDGCLIIRYEDLVLDYDIQEKRVHEYLGITNSDHVLRQKYFKPNFSKRFVGIYKSMPNLNKDYERIKLELFEYCNPMID